VIKHTRQAVDRGQAARAAWQKDFDSWAAANPQRKALLDRLAARELPDGWTDVLPTWEPDPKGVATRGDLAKLESLAEMVRNTSLCGLGQGAPNPVTNTLRYFRAEYLAHIDDHICPAGACQMEPALAGAPAGQEAR